MEDKYIENILNQIIEIDQKTCDEVKGIKAEIIEREKQLKSIIKDIEENSNKLKLQQSKKLNELIMDEAYIEKEKIESECCDRLRNMDALFEQNKGQMIQNAIKRLSIGRGGA